MLLPHLPSRLADVALLVQIRASHWSPLRFRWWVWPKLLGAAGLVFLTIVLVAGHHPHPVVVAILIHLAADFTFQSPQTAMRKEERSHHLLVHALVAGGLPLAVAGLIIGNPVAVLTGSAIGVASHYAVDWSRKFGLKRAALAVGLDQTCHLLSVLLIVLNIC
jgi:hypothetical protein